jgi:N utilization substance protein B
MSNNDRTRGRELALKFLYNKAKITPDNIDDELIVFLESYQVEDDEHPENALNDHAIFFGKKIITHLLSDQEKWDELVSNHIGDWKIEKLDRMDYCILLIGAYELSAKETPPQVIINECINLAKSYSAAQSYRFINGVLDGINSRS